MATLTRVASEPKPFTPEPITDEEAGAMFRTTLNLFQLWGVNDDQAATILDVPRRTFARWKAGDVGRLGRDGKARLSNLMGIHKALKIVFSEASRGLRVGQSAKHRIRRAIRARRDARRRADRPYARPALSRRGARWLVIDPASVPTASVSWTGARRIIRSLYPPIDLFEDIADPEDWPLLIAAEQKTNPRLMETLGALDLVPADRRVAGPGATYLMAPFTHVSPDRPSRFTRGEYGVLYVAERFETALLETMHHRRPLHGAHCRAARLDVTVPRAHPRHCRQPARSPRRSRDPGPGARPRQL